MIAVTRIAGIPLPSDDPVFLGLIVVHVGFGLAAVATGLVAMLSRKQRGRHPVFGTIYFWTLAGLFATMSALSFLRWAEDSRLFMLGVPSFAAALWGRWNIRNRNPRRHLVGMGASYILMLTAFYVDNGQNLPLWDRLPHVAYWIAPGAIGLPIIVWYLVRPPKFRF